MTSRRDRLEVVHELLSALARGEFAVRGELSADLDDVDAIIAGINMLGEELEAERAARRRAELGLQDAVSAYDGAPALFCSIEPSGFVVTRCNQTMATSLGLDREALVGQPLLERYPAAQRELARRCLEAIASGAAPPPGRHLLERTSGPPLVALLSGTRVLDERGALERLRLIYRDVTDEQRLEGQLQQAQKLDAIGQLAGGIAHDFNNLLTVMLGLTTSLASEVSSAEAKAELGELTDAVQRAAELTRQLLAFSRRSPLQSSVLDVNGIVSRAERLLRRTLGGGVTLTTSLAPDAWPVLANETQVEQVVLNLAINAREAMPGGGLLTIETKNVVRDAPAHGGRGGDHLLLSVHDTGTGIPLEVQRRVFEPFFTTREVGKGTGLGLAVAYGVVTQAGGSIDFESVPGEGTTFRVWLPRAAGAVGHRAGVAASPAPHRETILCVDDDPRVRHVTVRILRRAGYRVLEADGAAAALSVLREHAARVDLLLCDVQMPGTRGPVLAKQVIDGGLAEQVLFISGYPAEGGGLDWPLLAKPYSGPVLLERLDALFATRRR